MINVDLDGVEFGFSGSWKIIRIWNPGGKIEDRFVNLQRAYYDLGLITRENVLAIHEAYYGGGGEL